MFWTLSSKVLEVLELFNSRMTFIEFWKHNIFVFILLTFAKTTRDIALISVSKVYELKQIFYINVLH